MFFHQLTGEKSVILDSAKNRTQLKNISAFVPAIICDLQLAPISTNFPAIINWEVLYTTFLFADHLLSRVPVSPPRTGSSCFSRFFWNCRKFDRLPRTRIPCWETYRCWEPSKRIWLYELEGGDGPIHSMNCTITYIWHNSNHVTNNGLKVEIFCFNWSINWFTKSVK